METVQQLANKKAIKFPGKFRKTQATNHTRSATKESIKAQQSPQSGWTRPRGVRPIGSPA